MQPLLSIVIPTKDRYKYLKHLINLIDSFNFDEIEIIIQDNTKDNLEFEEYLEKKNDTCIKYFHIREPLPVSKNCDLAILNSAGEYVCMIGDDDGVTNFILDCVIWMKENEVDALIPSLVSYHWPDFVNGITGNVSGTISYKPFKNTFRFKNPIESLEEIMAKGFINRGELPLVYHGIVKRNVLEKIYEIGGTYFPGPSPDIANGVALSLLVKKYVQLDFPIIISGASATHGGGIRKLKNKVANIEDMKFLPQNAKKNWEKNIPKVWTGETVWPESAIKALHYMDREDLIEKVNFEYMLANFVAFHLPIGNIAIKLAKNKLRLWYYIIQIIALRYFNALRRVIWRKLFNTSDGKITIRDIENIEKVAEHLTNEQQTFTIRKKYN